MCIAGSWSVVQAQSAARVGDNHTCPIVEGFPPIPHVGGPILAPGVPTVLIGNSPAAVVGTAASCVGPPDTIVQGEATVLIGGSPAARMGDGTAHGGEIVQGSPTVLIGSSKSGGAALEDQAATLEGLLEDLGEDEAVRNALASVLILIGHDHEQRGHDAAAHSAYARALAAIEPVAAAAEADYVLVTYAQALVLNGRAGEASSTVAELQRRGFADPHFTAYFEHHGLAARLNGGY
jgi:uncharacterized Zn-binding protein involved in type VI secretion